MNTQCSKCGIGLEPSWTFCPHCGVAVTHEIQYQIQHKEAALPHEKTSAKGGFGGLLIGVVIAPMFVIVGAMLCLTGIGVFLGLPMILVGVLAPLAGPMFGLGEHRGKCPSCGTNVVTITDGLSHKCPACNEEFVVGSVVPRVGRA